MKKCPRCLGNDMYERYHDEERGVPVYDDRVLFEFLVLEGAQAGLSWLTVLKRREGYRQAFVNWDTEEIACFDEEKIDALLQNSAIIRNKLKVRATIKNARIFLAIQKEWGSFATYIRSWTNNTVVKNTLQTLDQCPASTPLSDSISKDLKKRGMSFVGSTIIYAYLQAVGIVNDHVVDCWRYTMV